MDFLEIVLDPLEFVPAPAQGVLGLQIRTEDKELFELLQTMNNSKVQKEINLDNIKMPKDEFGELFDIVKNNAIINETLINYFE